MTLDRYGHLFPGLHDRAADAVDAAYATASEPSNVELIGSQHKPAADQRGSRKSV